MIFMLFSLQVYYTGMKDSEVEGFTPEEHVVTTADDSTSIVLTELVPDTTYTITVAAITGAGEGERSESATGRTDPARKLHCRSIH